MRAVHNGQFIVFNFMNVYKFISRLDRHLFFLNQKNIFLQESDDYEEQHIKLGRIG